MPSAARVQRRPRPLAESPEAALRQLRDRGVDGRAGRRRCSGERLICPGLHRPSQRGPPPHHPAKSWTPSPRSSTGWNTPSCCRASAPRPWPPSPRRSKPSGCTDTVRGDRPTVLDEVGRAGSRRAHPVRGRAAHLPRAGSGAAARSIPSSERPVPPASCASAPGSAATATATPTSRTPSPPRRSACSRKTVLQHYLDRVDGAGPAAKPRRRRS